MTDERTPVGGGRHRPARSLAALALGLILAARYRQLHERVHSANADDGPPVPAPGVAPPHFDVVARDGGRVDGAALRSGRAVVVVFDTSCSACAEFLPEISAFLADRPEESAGLALIGGTEAALGPYLATCRRRSG